MNNFEVLLRAAELKDSDLVLVWRNDPEAVRQSVSGVAVEKKVHRRWFREAVVSSKTVLLIAEALLTTGVTPIGMCRFDSGEAGIWKVSLNINPDFRGRGLGGRVLQSSLSRVKVDWGPEVEIQAVVHESNLPSLRVFETVGFSVFAKEGPWVSLRLSPKI